VRVAADVRVGVVERLRARQEELVEAISARVRSGVSAGAGDRDAEYVAGLRAAVAAAVEYGLEGIERGDDERAGPVPLAVLAQARRAARTGVSLDTMLRRYVVGHTLLGEFVLEEADRGPWPDEHGALRRALRVQASVLDRLLAAITVEYGDELRLAERSPEQRRYERVRRLLAGGAVERSELDYELSGWHVGAIAVGTGAAQAAGRLAAGLDRRLLRVGQGRESVWAWLGGRGCFAAGELERIAVGAAAAPEAAGVTLALGEPARGLDGWRLTHRQAQAALLVALRRREPPAVTRYAEVALLAFALGDELLAGSLIEIYLAPLDGQRDGGAILRETLRAYFAAGRNVSSAATALGVARNTVDNRLRTVEQCLGRALGACMAELEVALRLEELGALATGESSSLGPS
jgi:hypothetical protein